MTYLLEPVPLVHSKPRPQITPFDVLQARLVEDGFPTDYLQRLYQQTAVIYDINTVALFFRHSEARLNYGRYTTERAIADARGYQKEHAATLASVAEKYGVPPGVVTAILLVESWLGTRTGYHSVFNTLSTMASLHNPKARRYFWQNMPTERRISRERYLRKSSRKSAWAYKELKALLTYCRRSGLNPVLIKGSYAGAMGICQFMPSNILPLAKDGNGDNRIDLFNHQDAMHSVGNYLAHHGWRKGIDPQKAYRVILKYNYSRYYAKTILAIAEKLKT